jgi:hypothetical protein
VAGRWYTLPAIGTPRPGVHRAALPDARAAGVAKSLVRSSAVCRYVLRRGARWRPDRRMFRRFWCYGHKCRAINCWASSWGCR